MSPFVTHRFTAKSVFFHFSYRCLRICSSSSPNWKDGPVEDDIITISGTQTDITDATHYSNAVGVLHGCRLSSFVVLCNGCIVAKRCKIGPTLLLITNRKSNTGFQMTLKSLTLNDLEHTMVCQSCSIVATR